MSVSSRRYVRVPPDSTGKRVGNSFALYLEYTNRVGTFEVGQTVVGGTSGVSGLVLEVQQIGAATTGTLVLELTGQYFDSSFSLGEDLLVNAVAVASTSNTGEEVFYNEVVIVGGNDPTNKQFIDEEGAQNIRFPEGSAQFTSFGGLNVTNIKNVIAYENVGTTDTKLSAIYQGAATSSYIQSQSLIQLENTTANGDDCLIRSNIWHKYEPGVPMQGLFTVNCGVNDTVGVVRRWGLFDDEDGLFFEQSGSVLYVVQRSSTTGTAVDTKIAQADWNNDRVNGQFGTFNLSGYNLDTEKMNVYFIDYQWLGAGSVRFGIYSAGKRIILHTVENPNQNTGPYMRKPSFPISVQQTNLEETATNSTMRFLCAAAQSSHDYSPHFSHRSSAISSLVVEATASAWAPIFSARSAPTTEGSSNRTHGIIEHVDVYVSASSPEPVLLTAFIGADLSGSIWQAGLVPNTPAEFDVSASGSSGGRQVYTAIIPVNEQVHLEGVKDAFSPPENWITRNADISIDPAAITLAYKPLTGDVTASVSVAFAYKEYAL